VTHLAEFLVCPCGDALFYINEQPDSVQMSQLTYVNESIDLCKWVISESLMSEMTHCNISWVIMTQADEFLVCPARDTFVHINEYVDSVRMS